MTTHHDKPKRLMWAILIADLLALLVYVDFEFGEAKERQAVLHQQAETELLLRNLRESLAESQALSSSDDSDDEYYERIPLDDVEQLEVGDVLRQIERHFGGRMDDDSARQAEAMAATVLGEDVRGRRDAGVRVLCGVASNDSMGMS